MSSQFTVIRTFHVKHGHRSRTRLGEGAKTAVVLPPRVPRVSRLMALAIRCDQLIRDGQIDDRAELSRLGQVTRARVTQLMNLLDLAPDIQQEILFLQPAERGRERITERTLRPIVGEPNWRKQRLAWRQVMDGPSEPRD